MICMNDNCPYWIDNKKELNCKDLTKKVLHEELVSGFDEGVTILTCNKYISEKLESALRKLLFKLYENRFEPDKLYIILSRKETKKIMQEIKKELKNEYEIMG